MVTIGMNYTVLPEKTEVFERAFQRVLEAMQQMDGHSKSSLYRDVSQSNVYLILSEWNDKFQFDHFIRSETFAKVTQWGKEQILAGPPKHRTFTEK